MKTETFIKRFGKDHPAVTIPSFISGFTKGLNGEFYQLTKTKKGIVAKKLG